MKLNNAIQEIKNFAACKNLDKQALVKYCFDVLKLEKRGSIFRGDSFTLRLCQAKGAGFSNTVLGLKKLMALDSAPFVVCVIRNGNPEFMLANTTLLSKISHSSKKLTETNIKGSFLGGDIMKKFNGVENTPNNFQELFNHHLAISPQDNLQRLVAATKGIKGYDTRFNGSEEQVRNILKSPNLASRLVVTDEFKHAIQVMTDGILSKKKEILEAAKIDNVNLRGNTIEKIVTGQEPDHAFADETLHLEDGSRILFDIKSFVEGKNSSPKGFNVDKLLDELSDGKTAVFICAIHVSENDVSVDFINVFGKSSIEQGGVNHHWSGRNSRGTIQYAGDFLSKKDISIDAGREFVKSLLFSQ